MVHLSPYPNHPPLPVAAVAAPFPHSPVAFPSVPHVGVVDVVLVRLLVQEVEHVLDSQGQGTASVRRAEDGLKEVVDKLL